MIHFSHTGIHADQHFCFMTLPALYFWSYAINNIFDAIFYYKVRGNNLPSLNKSGNQTPGKKLHMLTNIHVKSHDTTTHTFGARQ